MQTEVHFGDYGKEKTLVMVKYTRLILLQFGHHTMTGLKCFHLASPNHDSSISCTFSWMYDE